MVSRRTLCWLSVLFLFPAAGCRKSPSDSEETDSIGTDSGAASTDQTDVTTGGASHPVCDEYLACVAATMPNALPAAQAGFGPDGTCWKGSPEQAQQCIDACTSGKALNHEAFPDEPACFTCDSNEDCEAGQTCFKGGCGVGCGDGLVDPGEICDSMGDCKDDCKGPPNCSPLNDAGCDEGDQCYFKIQGIEDGIYTGYCDPPVDGGYGGQCPTVVYCGPGLYCLEQSRHVDCPMTDFGCCTYFCDLARPDTCPEGTVCVGLHGADRTVDESLRYLGLCEKSS